MNILRNLSKGLDVKTEAEIQFELAYKLKSIGFDIRLERTILLDTSFRTHKTDRNCSIRVDIMVLRKGKIVCVIEVKDYKKDSEINMDNRQFKKYASLGVPFVYCLSEKRINSSTKKVIQIYLRLKREGYFIK